MAMFARSSGEGDLPAAYEPTNTLKPIGENIWIVDGEPIKAMGLVLPVRMTVIRLQDGSVLLHSPIKLTPQLAAAIEALGTISHLVAPTIAHWTFLSEWQRRFPAAVTWGVPGLRDRLQVRASDVRIDRDLGAAAPPEWSADIQQGLLHGLGFHEAYFFHQPSRTLVLTDLVQNLELEKLPPVTALAARVARAAHARTSAHVRATILLGGGRARHEIAQMIALEPEQVVFAHGQWFAENGAARLKQAFDWL
jgi:hypothetical protein